MTLGPSGQDRAVVILSRSLAAEGFVVTRAEPDGDVHAAVAAAAADRETVVGISVRGHGGLADLERLLATLPRPAPAARSLFVGGDFAADEAAQYGTRHRVRFFSRESTTRTVIDWLLGGARA